MVRVAARYLQTRNRRQISRTPHYILLKQVYQSLNILTHLLLSLPRLQLTEIQVREGRIEKLQEKSIAEEDPNVVHWLVHAQHLQNIVAQVENRIANYKF